MSKAGGPCVDVGRSLDTTGAATIAAEIVCVSAGLDIDRVVDARPRQTQSSPCPGRCGLAVRLAAIAGSIECRAVLLWRIQRRGGVAYAMPPRQLVSPQLELG